MMDSTKIKNSLHVPVFVYCKILCLGLQSGRDVLQSFVIFHIHTHP